MEKDIEIYGKKYKLREMSYITAVKLEGLTKDQIAREMFKSCAGLSDEEIDKLSIKEGVALTTAINTFNNPVDFQNPTEEKTN